MNIVNPTKTMIELAEADPARWRWMTERAPENDTLDLLLDLDGPPVTGWCSYRFMSGHPTFWARDSSGRAGIVFPRRWRVAA